MDLPLKLDLPDFENGLTLFKEVIVVLIIRMFYQNRTFISNVIDEFLDFQLCGFVLQDFLNVKHEVQRVKQRIERIFQNK